MAFETRFSEQEQILLGSLPTLIGSAMTFAGGSGMGTVKEMFASSQSLLEGSREFASNEIVAGVLPNMTDIKSAMSESSEMKEKFSAHLKQHEVKSSEEMIALAVQDCKTAADLLATKATPVEAQEYKTWLLNIAENVAKAAKEGGFLIFGGTLVSDGEQKLFSEISSALGVTRVM